MSRTSKPTAASRRRSPARPGLVSVAPPPGVADLLREFAEVAARAGVAWYVFGAQAVAAYGVPRTTADVDVTVVLGAVSVERLVAGLTRAGFALKVRDPAFVRETRVLPARHLASGWDLDVVLAGPGIEELFAARVRRLQVADLVVPVIAPEDLIATKLLAQRPKDLEDIRGLLRTAPNLDRAQLTVVVALLEEALAVSDLAPLLASLEPSSTPAATQPARRPAARTTVARGPRPGRKAPPRR